MKKMFHKNHYQTIVAGIAVVKNKEGKILFMRRSEKEAYAAGKWDFPGGAKEFLESAEEGTIRECKEESGIDITLKKLLWHRVSKGAMNEETEFISFFFLADPHSETVTLSEEHDAYQWLTIEESKQLETIPWMQDFYKALDKGIIDLN